MNGFEDNRKSHETTGSGSTKQSTLIHAASWTLKRIPEKNTLNVVDRRRRRGHETKRSLVLARRNRQRSLWQRGKWSVRGGIRESKSGLERKERQGSKGALFICA